MSIVKILPDFRSGGGAQMALDAGLLETVDEVIARRYTWAPPALSIGKFQELQIVPGLPFEVVRRPSGGRAVLHGEAFEWSFAVAFPPGVLGGGPRAAVDVGGPYGLVAGALRRRARGARRDAWTAAARRRTSGARSASPARCATTSAPRGEKIVADRAGARRRGARSCTAPSSCERPPDELTLAVETLLGEPWQGEGLAGAGVVLAPETIWNAMLRASRGRPAGAASTMRRNAMTKVLVLGGGPAGYVAAGRAAQLGAEVTVVEAREIGGTCLNRGCIPTKAMVAGAARLHEARRAAEYGVQVGEVGLDFAAFMARKDAATTQLRDGVAHLLKARKVRGGGRAGYARRPRPPGPRARRDPAGRDRARGGRRARGRRRHPRQRLRAGAHGPLRLVPTRAS